MPVLNSGLRRVRCCDNCLGSREPDGPTASYRYGTPRDGYDEDGAPQGPSVIELCARCRSVRCRDCQRCGVGVFSSDGYTVPCPDPLDGHEFVCYECYRLRFMLCRNCERNFEITEANPNPLGERGMCHRCLQAEWGCDFKADDRITRTRSTRLYGVELETASVPTDFIEQMAGLPFRTVHDGSITGKEIISRPMSGDKGLEAIETMCERMAGSTVNRECGFHIHLDARDLTRIQMWNVVMGYRCTQKAWFSLVHPNRHNNQYCEKMGIGPATINRCLRDGRSVGEYAACRDYEYRYKWFNVMAYNKHRTLEVRLHSGTMNAEKITNWVVAHTRFWEWLIHQSEPDAIYTHFNRKNVWGKLVNIWESDALARYFTARREQFASEPELVEV